MLVVDITDDPSEQPQKLPTLEPGDKRLFVEVEDERARYEAAHTAPSASRQIVVKVGAGAYAVHSYEELNTLKEQAALSACQATGISNLSMHILFKGSPVTDEAIIFDVSDKFADVNEFTLQAVLPGGGYQDG